METIIRDAKILLQEFERNGDPEPLKRLSDVFDQMAPDVAEHEDILVLRVMVDFSLRRWARARDHLVKLIMQDPDNSSLYNDLANLNFKLDDFAAVVENLRQYFRLAADPSEPLPYHAMSSALHALGRGDEATAFLDDAVRRDPALAIYRNDEFLEQQQAALARGLRPIFLNTLFKSASIHIATRLAEGLQLPRCHITEPTLRGDEIIPSWLELFAKGGAICQEHLPARRDVLDALAAAGIDRIVVHTRDPRQSMISGVHHYADMFSAGSFEGRVFVARLPVDYCQWDFIDQVDHYLEHYFEPEARWVADWQGTARQGTFPGRILLTSYERFRRNNRAYFEALLDFHEIPFEIFDWSQIDIQPERGVFHYRSGETNEWERVLKGEQVSRANSIMAAVGLDPDSFEC
ncbi:MAG: hypothetical protein QF384_16305 [Alphaproteobacteria bacterium]|jgi:tetratricopeptide (TPR) repeat protein|nr:hypothetical protein [Alphaproteobacteria bacterium]MDP6831950.1 hypothetical protein [Alphaproteobacteria bacterium]